MIQQQRQAIAAGVTLAALIASVSLGVWTPTSHVSRPAPERL